MRQKRLKNYETFKNVIFKEKSDKYLVQYAVNKTESIQATFSINNGKPITFTPRNCGSILQRNHPVLVVYLNGKKRKIPLGVQPSPFIISFENETSILLLKDQNDEYFGTILPNESEYSLIQRAYTQEELWSIFKTQLSFIDGRSLKKKAFMNFLNLKI